MNERLVTIQSIAQKTNAKVLQIETNGESSSETEQAIFDAYIAGLEEIASAYPVHGLSGINTLKDRQSAVASETERTNYVRILAQYFSSMAEIIPAGATTSIGAIGATIQVSRPQPGDAGSLFDEQWD